MDELQKEENLNHQNEQQNNEQQNNMQQNNMHQNNEQQNNEHQNNVHHNNVYQNNEHTSGLNEGNQWQNGGQNGGYPKSEMRIYSNGMPTNGMPTSGMPMNGMPMNGMPMDENSMNGNTYYNMPYHNKKPRRQIIFYNPGVSDFDSLSMHPKFILGWSFFSLFVLAVVVLGVSNLIDYVVKITNPAIAEADWYVWAVTFISIVLFGLPIYYLVIKRIPDSPKGQVQPLKVSTFFIIFMICAAAMYITNMYSVFITFMISVIKGEDLINPLNEVMLGGNVVITLLYASIVAPIVEEIIFRGLLLNKLRRFGDIPAILLSGLAFGFFHFNLSQFFYAAVLGFIFAYVAIRTNTIKYSIILHVMINFIASVAAPFVAKGNIVAGLILSGWVFSSIIVGTILFILSIKKLRLEKGPKVVKGSSYILNIGTILYMALSLAMIVISIVRT